MCRELEAIEKRVIQLPAEERETIASRLFGSLGKDCLDLVAWEEEIARRIENIAPCCSGKE
ncbi:MAG: hypothetical protein AAGH40_13280 [Verrucomicrobiota bacterium]